MTGFFLIINFILTLKLKRENLTFVAIITQDLKRYKIIQIILEFQEFHQNFNHAMAKLIRNGSALAISRELLLEDRFEELGKLFHLQPLLNVP
jgi:hypothetical protein